MEFDLDKLVRENIKRLKPYSSARKEFTGQAQIFLDANENSLGSPIEKNYHRYPDPLQIEIKKIVAERNRIKTDQIFIGNGSDEAIDLLFRIFLRTRKRYEQHRGNGPVGKNPVSYQSCFTRTERAYPAQIQQGRLRMGP